MPRQPRTDHPGAIHHVTARGNNRQPVFRDDADNWVFLQMLGATCSTHNLVAVAWCLMGNHFHLVLESREGGLGAAMHQLTHGYAKRYNNRHRHSGHVFLGGYQSMLVNRDAYLLEVVRYVLLNPVRAGMCRSAGDWRWSSAREALDQRPCPTWADFSIIYGLLEPENGRPAEHLARFLERGHRRRQVPGTELRSVPGTS
jgi:REP element-mobilizing transposase RayT